MSVEQIDQLFHSALNSNTLLKRLKKEQSGCRDADVGPIRLRGQDINRDQFTVISQCPKALAGKFRSITPECEYSCKQKPKAVPTHPAR